MQKLIADALANLLVVSALTLAFALLLLLVLQRERFAGTLKGIASVVGSIITGPLHFARMVLGQLADRGSRPSRQPQSDRQLLARRLMTGVQLGIVLAGLMILSVGAATAFNITVPARADVRAHRAALIELDTLSARVPRQQAIVAALDTAWARDGMAMLAAYADSLTGIAAAASAEYTAIRVSLQERPVTPARRQLLELISDLQDESRLSLGTQRFERRLQSLMESRRALDSAQLARFGYTPEDSTILATYLSHWRTWKSATDRLRGWPNESSRDAVQPIAAASQTLDSLASQQASVQASLPALAESARWKFVQGAIVLAIAIGKAFLFIWIAGLLLELAGLFLDMVANLGQIRTQYDAAAADRGPPRRSSGVPAGVATYQPASGTGAVDSPAG